MKRLPPHFRWLVLAAVVDWLIGRTLSRSAIHIPKTAFVANVFEVANLVSQVAASFAGLLALWAVGWIAWRAWERRSTRPLALAFGAVLGLNVGFFFISAVGWLAVGYGLALLLLIGLLAAQAWRHETTWEKRLATVLPSATLLVTALYQLIPALSEGLRQTADPSFTMPLFNLGELLAVLCPFAWWRAYGRGASRRTWVVGGLIALLFVGMRLASPSTTGTLAIWSSGFTLYLPWPLYAASLWVATVSAITALQRGEVFGWAILLLAASGYAPQLSTQMLCALIALWLMAGTDGQAAITPGYSPVTSAIAMPS